MENFKDLTKKAYMLEFYDKKSFTFSVPPESETLTYTFRKSETRTFGGLHIDEYGLDALKISIKGSTINTEVRMCGEKRIANGEEEINELRDMLYKYKSSIPDCGKPVVFYDLSKTGVAWNVSIDNFRVERTNTKPFVYQWSIECTALPRESTNNSPKSDTKQSGSGSQPKINQEQIANTGPTATETQRNDIVQEQSEAVNNQAQATSEEINKALQGGQGGGRAFNVSENF